MTVFLRLFAAGLVWTFAVLNPPACLAQAYGNPMVSRIARIVANGSRARFTPDGNYLVFDARNAVSANGAPSGYYQLYVSDLSGNIQPTSLTNNRNITQLNNGNAALIYPTASTPLIAFISEANPHYLSTSPPVGQQTIGDSGVGLFSNLWFTDGVNFTQQTNVPIKMTVNDGITPYATVNPRFSPNGAMLVWTERYSNFGALNWGKWRLRAADIVPNKLPPVNWVAANQRILFTPPVGNYVTAMGFLSQSALLVSGNLDGQNEYGMDLYNLNLTTGAYTNLTNSPLTWEEGACIAPSGKIVYMSNQNSAYTLNFSQPWAGQPLTREYFVMNSDGSGKQQLTYFNTPGFQEYTGYRTVPIVCDVSPDGTVIAATIGHDYGTATAAYLVWEVWLIRLTKAL